MADAYWRYSDARQPPPSAMNSVVGKRPRSDYDAHGGHDLPSYYSHEDDRGSLRGIRDTDSINASYDRYLRSAQMPSYSGGQSARTLSGGLPGRSVDDPRMMGMGGVEPGAPVKDRVLGMGSGRPEAPLPPGATSTLFVEGLPPNCTRREVAHIFRPFVGYKEVRLVSKESRHPGGDPLVLCFVDFVSPAHAATAMDALQVLFWVLFHGHLSVCLVFITSWFHTTRYFRPEVAWSAKSSSTSVPRAKLSKFFQTMEGVSFLGHFNPPRL